ncbi:MULTISPECIES: SDR family NAD(P)-dependent oxidoreductase [Erwinia]|uniref:SDR family oxidoreductase n=1 Tax=Erwinia TaxID=551 RepID=UPI000551A00C|nr:MULTISPECIES: SDR family NAD(P)-dependent oxidoreductase [Erwinia]
MAVYSDLADKNVLITGSSGDIGLALCKQYLEQQCKVYAVYHHNSAELEALKQAHPAGENLFLLRCDITQREDVARLAGQLEAEISALHVLVNNAGLCKDTLFSEMNWEMFDSVVQTNLYGTFNVCKSFFRLLTLADAAAIVNVSSIAGVTSSFGQTNYSAAKAGVIGFTRTLAAEYAARGIRVNAIAPGVIDSRMVKKVPRQIMRAIMTAIPLRRQGNVDEVANVATFLSSSSASYIVGQTLIVDGGLIMR